MRVILNVCDGIRVCIYQRAKSTLILALFEIIHGCWHHNRSRHCLLVPSKSSCSSYSWLDLNVSSELKLFLNRRLIKRRTKVCSRSGLRLAPHRGNSLNLICLRLPICSQTRSRLIRSCQWDSEEGGLPLVDDRLEILRGLHCVIQHI